MAREAGSSQPSWQRERSQGGARQSREAETSATSPDATGPCGNSRSGVLFPNPGDDGGPHACEACTGLQAQDGLGACCAPAVCAPALPTQLCNPGEE